MSPKELLRMVAPVWRADPSTEPDRCPILFSTGWHVCTRPVAITHQEVEAIVGYKLMDWCERQRASRGEAYAPPMMTSQGCWESMMEERDMTKVYESRLEAIIADAKSILGIDPDSTFDIESESDLAMSISLGSAARPWCGPRSTGRGWGK